MSIIGQQEICFSLGQHWLLSLLFLGGSQNYPDRRFVLYLYFYGYNYLMTVSGQGWLEIYQGENRLVAAPASSYTAILTQVRIYWADILTQVNNNPKKLTSFQYEFTILALPLENFWEYRMLLVRKCFLKDNCMNLYLWFP